MADTFTPAPGTVYSNLNGPNKGVTYASPGMTLQQLQKLQNSFKLPTNTAPNSNQQGVLGLSTSLFSGGGGSSQPSTNTNPSNNQVISSAQLAQQQAMANYNSLKNQLGGQLSSLKSNEGDLLGQIGSAYGNAIQNAGNAYQSNLGTLQNTQNTVQNQYANEKEAEGNNIRDAQAQNNALARAVGADGSYVNQLNSQTMNQGVAGLNSIGTNETNQLGQIANSIASANSDYTTKLGNLNTLEAQAKQGVTDQYQGAYNQIQNYMAQTGVDQTNTLNQIGSEMQSTLDNISYLMGQYKSSVQQGLGQNASSSDLSSALQQIVQQNPAQVSNYVVDPSTGQTTSALQSDISQLANQSSPGNLNSIAGYFNPQQLQQQQQPYQVPTQ